jgi:hypothetical protein
MLALFEHLQLDFVSLQNSLGADACAFLDVL